jgi:hypothetical protein
MQIGQPVAIRTVGFATARGSTQAYERSNLHLQLICQTQIMVLETNRVCKFEYECQNGHGSLCFDVVLFQNARIDGRTAFLTASRLWQNSRPHETNQQRSKRHVLRAATSGLLTFIMQNQ